MTALYFRGNNRMAALCRRITKYKACMSMYSAGTGEPVSTELNGVVDNIGEPFWSMISIEQMENLKDFKVSVQASAKEMLRSRKFKVAGQDPKNLFFKNALKRAAAFNDKRMALKAKRAKEEAALIAAEAAARSKFPSDEELEDKPGDSEATRKEKRKMRRQARQARRALQKEDRKARRDARRKRYKSWRTERKKIREDRASKREGKVGGLIDKIRGKNDGKGRRRGRKDRASKREGKVGGLIDKIRGKNDERRAEKKERQEDRASKREEAKEKKKEEDDRRAQEERAAKEAKEKKKEEDDRRAQEEKRKKKEDRRRAKEEKRKEKEDKRRARKEKRENRRSRKEDPTLNEMLVHDRIRTYLRALRLAKEIARTRSPRHHAMAARTTELYGTGIAIGMDDDDEADSVSDSELLGNLK